MTKLNIYQRVNELLAEGIALPKTGKMDSGAGGFAFYQTDEVLSVLRPMLVRHRISLSYSVEEHACEKFELTTSKGPSIQKQTTKRLRMRLTNIDDPKDYIEGYEVGYGIDAQDKGPGKATSYAVKTFLLNIFMLRGQPDEDRLDSFDGFIGGAELDDLRELIDKAKPNMARLLKAANADCVEHIKFSQLGIVRNMLNEKLAKAKV